MKYVEPRYTIPDRTTFSRTIIPDLYTKVSLKVMELLKKCEVCFIYFWLMVIQQQYWLCVHNLPFYQWRIRQREPVTRSYTIQANFPHKWWNLYVYHGNFRKMGYWRKKIHVYLRDNAANMEKAFSDKQFHTFGCFTHSLQLVRY